MSIGTWNGKVNWNKQRSGENVDLEWHNPGPVYGYSLRTYIVTSAANAFLETRGVKVNLIYVGLYEGTHFGYDQYIV